MPVGGRKRWREREVDGELGRLVEVEEEREHYKEA